MSTYYIQTENVFDLITEDEEFDNLVWYLFEPVPPRDVNAEVFFCEQICTESGTTVVSVAVPHPVWTDAYGIAVTQMNMVTLGGNGLNA